MLHVFFALFVVTNASYDRPSVVEGMDISRLALYSDWIDEQIDDSKIAGASFVVYRNNKLVYESYNGHKNINDTTSINSKISKDTIFRLFSITKPVTAVALMMLYEENKFKLSDPLYKYIPEFQKEDMIGIYDFESNKNLSVEDLRTMPLSDIKTIPIENDIQMWQVLTHTAGLSYGFDHSGHVQPVDVLYQDLNAKLYYNGELTSEQFANELTKLPLIFEPGTEWEYSFAADLQGRLVEVISGQSLDEYLYENMFEPLGMYSTAFKINDIDPSKENLATLYRMDSEGILHETNDVETLYEDDFPFISGGMGLLSTMHDYSKFTQMLVNGGKLPGKNNKRLLSSKTVDLIRMNHLPKNMDIASMLHSHSIYPDNVQGVGFGLGFGNYVNLRASDGVCNIGSLGKYWWSGASETWFFIDPVEHLSAVFMTQLMGASDGVYEDFKGAQPEFGDALSRFIYASFADE